MDFYFRCKTDHVYALEPSQYSKEHPQYMYWARVKQTRTVRGSDLIPAIALSEEKDKSREFV